jgi:hypothetical protein
MTRYARGVRVFGVIVLPVTLTLCDLDTLVRKGRNDELECG